MTSALLCQRFATQKSILTKEFDKGQGVALPAPSVDRLVMHGDHRNDERQDLEQGSHTTRLPSINYIHAHLMDPPKLHPYPSTVGNWALVPTAVHAAAEQVGNGLHYRVRQYGSSPAQAPLVTPHVGDAIGLPPSPMRTVAGPPQTALRFVGYGVPAFSSGKTTELVSRVASQAETAAVSSCSAPLILNNGGQLLPAYYSSAPSVVDRISYFAPQCQPVYNQRWIGGAHRPMLSATVALPSSSQLYSPSHSSSSSSSMTSSVDGVNSTKSDFSASVTGGAGAAAPNQKLTVGSLSAISPQLCGKDAETRSPQPKVLAAGEASVPLGSAVARKPKSKAGRKPLGDSKVKRYPCLAKDCNKVFGRKSHRERHMNAHAGTRPFKCLSSECTSQFTRYDNMMQHYRRHHSLESDDAKV